MPSEIKHFQYELQIEKLLVQISCIPSKHESRVTENQFVKGKKESRIKKRETHYLKLIATKMEKAK